MTSFTTRIRRAIWTLIVLAVGTSVGAQPRQPAPCFALVQTALQAADAACEATGRNEVCYGNVSGMATPAVGVSDLVFNQVGDIAPVGSIRALQLSPLNEVRQEWGVAVMRLQANLPDTLPGQNVTFVLFGDVTIEDATRDQARVPGQVRVASNVRYLPSGDADVVGSLRRGQTALVTGKAESTTGSLWYRVKYDHYRTRTGWVLGELIDVDAELLPEVERTSLVANPMQAFYFRTGIGRQTCEEAPSDGVVVQTPEGVGMVTFNVNGVDVSLGSTAVITDTEDGLSFALMEGRGMIRAQGVMRVLVPGSETIVRMDEQFHAAEAPTMPQPIAPEMFAMASEAMDAMERPIDVPPPATMPQIERANTTTVIDVDLPVLLPSCPAGADPATCGCTDADRDGTCDITCEDRDRDGVCDPLVCIDLNMDGQCDGAICEDRDGDGRCDILDPCSGSAADCGCLDLNNNGICDVDEVVCTLGDCSNCTDRDADGRCDDLDPCVDSDGDGVCETCLGLPCNVLPTLIAPLPTLPIILGPTRTPTPTPTRTPATGA
ncbi:MAG: SH3 domain-containing protein [Chloroflexi bacterium]|nr:SH3 domain-containing protein [Chloroflexota bacterium]